MTVTQKKGSAKVLYVSGEESPEQIKLRAERLSINSDNIILLPETNLEEIISAAAAPRGGLFFAPCDTARRVMR